MRYILIAADAVDPDNLALVAGAGILYPDANVRLLLTGRPVNESGVTRQSPPREQFNNADPARSRQLQVRNAARFVEFARRFDVDLAVFDGGIAPRTLVPHWVHKDETQTFGDTPEDAESNSRLQTRDALVREILASENPVIDIIVGGPMTALRALFEEAPELIPFVHCCTAMFANWGPGSLMSLGGARTPFQQFNAAIDPTSANWILTGAPFPILLVPTETTKVPEITFGSIDALVAALPDTDRAKALVDLYRVWWNVAGLANRGGIIIYDLAPLMALDPELCGQIFQVVPVEVKASTHLPYELIPEESRPTTNAAARWGEVYLTKLEAGTPSTRFATLPELANGGAEIYLRTLHRICS